MLIFLLKSSACLAILLAFYKLLLEKESIHNFKRFYLLGSLVLSIVIPLITFTEYIEIQPLLNISPGIVVENGAALLQPESNLSTYLPLIIWSIYGVGVILLGTKFIYNLLQITSKINKNPKQKNTQFINVLMQDLITPHTFLNYIFLNKRKFENHQIPKEVLLHEESHAKQKHTLDIIFIEFLQILFWFNPLIYLSKKAIKLNHEYLADEAVLNQGIPPSTYQQILLSFSSNEKETPLAHAINYSLIKKRFTIMKTQTSKKAIWLRSLLLLPLLAGLLFSFSTTEVIQKENEETPNATELTQDKATKKQVSEYNKLAKHYNSLPQGKRVYKKSEVERMHAIYLIMTDKQKSNAEPYPNIPPPPPPAPLLKNETQKRAPSISGIACDYCELFLTKKAASNLIIGTTNNEIIKSFKVKFTEKSTLTINAKHLNNKAKSYISDSKIGDVFQIFDIKTNGDRLPPVIIRIVTDNDPKLTKSPKVKAGEVSNIPPPPPPAAKVKMGIHTPDAPPPPPIPENASIEKKKAYKAAILEHKKSQKEKMIQQKKAEKSKLAAQRKKQVAEIKKNKLEKNVKLKKSHKSTLDHVIHMAKKKATFFYNGKEISSDKAIELIKKNNKLNISSHTDNGKSTVHLSEKGITVKH